jgi:hypothetical protein
MTEAGREVWSNIKQSFANGHGMRQGLTKYLLKKYLGSHDLVSLRCVRSSARPCLHRFY